MGLDWRLWDSKPLGHLVVSHLFQFRTPKWWVGVQWGSKHWPQGNLGPPNTLTWVCRCLQSTHFGVFWCFKVLGHFSQRLQAHRCFSSDPPNFPSMSHGQSGGCACLPSSAENKTPLQAGSRGTGTRRTSWKTLRFWPRVTLVRAFFVQWYLSGLPVHLPPSAQLRTWHAP
jgi:hypothetical protein